LLYFDPLIANNTQNKSKHACAMLATAIFENLYVKSTSYLYSDVNFDKSTQRIKWLLIMIRGKITRIRFQWRIQGVSMVFEHLPF